MSCEIGNLGFPSYNACAGAEDPTDRGRDEHDEEYDSTEVAAPAARRTRDSIGIAGLGESFEPDEPTELNVSPASAPATNICRHFRGCIIEFL